MASTSGTSKFNEYAGEDSDSDSESSASSSSCFSYNEKMTKGEELAEFMKEIKDYTPTIPDAVISHITQNNGFTTNDPSMIRLISIATQKYVSDIVNDALQYRKMNDSGQNKKGPKDKSYTLTSEDLLPALEEHGININKPPYLV